MVDVTKQKEASRVVCREWRSNASKGNVEISTITKRAGPLYN